METTYTLGVDIGGTNFRLGVVGSDGRVSCFEKKSSEVFTTGNAVETLAKELEAYLEANGFIGKIKAAAVGLPSIVSRDKRTVYSTPNLKGFDNAVFGDTLEKHFGFPVFIDSDVNFLLQNDIADLGLDRTKTILGFYIGTGFGNAIFMNGSAYYGKNGAAGELGHIPLLDVDERCTCGNIGCAETRCSGKYLERLVTEFFPDTHIKKVFKEHGDHPVIQKFVRDLAIPIATEINILDPDYSIIAGGVVDMEGFPCSTLVEAVHDYTRKPYPEKNLELLFTRHEQISGVFGSGDYAHRMMKSKQSC